MNTKFLRISKFSTFFLVIIIIIKTINDKSCEKLESVLIYCKRKNMKNLVHIFIIVKERCDKIIIYVGIPI